MNKEVIDALRRLKGNRDFEAFMEFFESQSREAVRTAMTATEPVAIHRAQGAYHELTEIMIAVKSIGAMPAQRKTTKF